MELYLMQHGLAAAKEENPEQPLSREGVAQIKASATALKKMGITFEVIIASTKKRSKQTAALVAEVTNYPYSDIVKTELAKPMTKAKETIDFLQQFVDEGPVLIAGHLPSLCEVASALLTDGSSVNIAFENGGLCRIDVSSLPTSAAELRYCLTADQLRLIAG